MCGAATVMGAFVATVGMQPPINLVVVVPAWRTCRTATATPVGRHHLDVGQDHRSRQHRRRGRLILCDALTYRTLRTRALVDVATLTGACVVALGKYRAA